MRHPRTFAALAAVGAALLLTACGYAREGGGPGWGPGWGHGPMMGGGWGPGMMGEGYGPGMMGHGYGPGMMGYGGAMGYGGGLWGLERLDLGAEQRSRIAAIQDEARQQHWALMQAMHAGQGRRGGPPRGPFDAEADRRDYEAMAAQHRQMFELHLQTRQRILEVLTPAQREQLGRGWRAR